MKFLRHFTISLGLCCEFTEDTSNCEGACLGTWSSCLDSCLEDIVCISICNRDIVRCEAGMVISQKYIRKITINIY